MTEGIDSTNTATIVNNPNIEAAHDQREELPLGTKLSRNIFYPE